MVRSVGKLFFLALCYSLQVHAASIELQIFDAQNNELSTVGVGVPFLLRVSMQGFRKRVQEPIIPQLAVIGGVRVGDGQGSMIIRNNQSTVYFNYKARIDVAGSYTIGPISIDNDGDLISSKELVIEAGREIVALNASHKHKHKEKPIFLDFFVDAHQVFVGQKIACTARFYFTQDSGFTGLAQLSMPDLPGFVVGAVEGAQGGAEKIKGKEYQCVEWRWFIYPQQAGATMIPACCVDYEAETTRRNVSGGWISMFTRRGRDRIHSNSVHLTIDPLPPHDVPVVGVGSFNELSVTLEPSVIKEGAAAVLTVEIRGDGNSEQIDQYQLLGMPGSVKYYESKKYMVAPDQMSIIPRKRFEFIIQGLRPGEGEIPEQQFTYFDVKDHAYHTLISAPLPFSITPAAVSAATASGDTVSDKESDTEGEKLTDTGGVLPLSRGGQWYEVKERKPLPLWLFLVALLAPFIYMLGRALLYYVCAYYQKHELQMRSRRAFVTAKVAVKACREKQDVAGLYSHCMRLVAHRCMVAEAVVSRSWLIRMLESKKCNQQEIKETDNLLETLTYYSFGKGADKLLDTDIYTQVEQWISWLEKKI